MNKIKYLTFLLTMLFSLGSFSQEDNKESYKLKLTVRDANNKAVPGAVILIDGVKLSKLMIEYKIGVTEEKTISLCKLDSDFFDS